MMVSRKAALFILLACLSGWSLGFLYFALGGSIRSPLYFLFSVVYMWTPAAAGGVVRRWILREPSRRPAFALRINWWFLAALLGPLALVLAATGASVLLPGVSLSSASEFVREQIEALQLPAGQVEMVQRALEPLLPHLGTLFWAGQAITFLVAAPTINAAVALGEELGWRGLLLRELLPGGFWFSSLVIGVVWGVWHLPLILHGHNYPDHPVAGVFMMIALTVLLSPLFAYVRLRAGSVLAAAVAHGALNGSAGIGALLSGGSDLTVGITGGAGLSVLLLANLLLFVHLRGRDNQPRLEETPSPPPASLDALSP
ncbi:MAG: CPBP family intramembrane glutamic endopeptidase [Acidobacteriota bacterium]